MTTHKSLYTKGIRQMPTPQGAEVLGVSHAIAGVWEDLADNDIVEVFPLPAGCVPLSLDLVHDALDASTGDELTVDVGILNDAGDAISTAADDGGDEWLDGSTGLQTATVTSVGKAVLSKVKPVEKDRIIAIKIMTDAETDPAAAAQLKAILTYRAAHFDE